MITLKELIDNKFILDDVFIWPADKPLPPGLYIADGTRETANLKDDIMPDNYPSSEEMERYCKPGKTGEYHTHDMGDRNLLYLPAMPKGYITPWSASNDIPDGWKVIPWPFPVEIAFQNPLGYFNEPISGPLMDKDGNPLYVIIEKL